MCSIAYFEYGHRIVLITILCPYSKYAIEHIFFKFIKKDFFFF
ncbi:colicin E1 family microcin immunity protein [Shigella sonnei]|nr:colicin E1 family microcin immunity protein [Shigella sonnei]